MAPSLFLSIGQIHTLLTARRVFLRVKPQIAHINAFSQRPMAPKPIARTSSKRKADIESNDSDVEDGDFSQLSQSQSQSQSQSSSKRPRKTKEDTTDSEAINNLPTNKVLPVNIVVPAKQDGVLRIASWNVSGLAASEKKGFRHYVEAENPDILIITETKVNDVPADPSLKTRFPHQYWSISAKKGYSGTAILSKHKPLSVDQKIPGHPDPDSIKGRIVTLEFESCFLVGTYVVNAGQGLKTLAEKQTWNTHFFKYLTELDKKKPVIWAGDFNVAPQAIDLSNAKKNWNKTAGYTEAETSAFNNFLSGSPGEETTQTEDTPNKFLDIWRTLHPEQIGYSYFSYRFNCRGKGLGWRIDGFVISERLKDRVKSCEIRHEIYGASDHVPVVFEIDGTL